MSKAIKILNGGKLVFVAAALVLAVVLANGVLSAQAQTAATSSTEAMTVYLPGHDAGKITKEVNDAHKQYVPEGWTPVAVTTHMENNDFKGMWVTYVRTVSR